MDGFITKLANEAAKLIRELKLSAREAVENTIVNRRTSFSRSSLRKKILTELGRRGGRKSARPRRKQQNTLFN